MGTITDLPIRESTNPRWSDPAQPVVLTMPTFVQWMKAGAGFTIGALAVTFVAGLFWTMFILANLASVLRR